MLMNPPVSDLLVRNLEVKDLPAVATVHKAAFPKSALTMLGTEAVRRYYEWQLLGPHESISLGAFLGPEVVGFCVGGIFRGAMISVASGMVARRHANTRTAIIGL